MPLEPSARLSLAQQLVARTKTHTLTEACLVGQRRTVRLFAAGDSFRILLTTTATDELWPDSVARAHELASIVFWLPADAG